MNDKLVFRPAVYIFLFLYFILGFVTLVLGDKIALWLYDEDRYFEYVGALSLFIASGIAFYTFYVAQKNKVFWAKRLIYLAIAVLYFFGAGEEISWGQRIFGIEQPEVLAEENVQDELNIHNLAFFENSKLLKADNIFSIFWLGFTVLLPLGALLSEKFRTFASHWVPIVHWSIGLIFLFNYVLAQIVEPLFRSTYTFAQVPYIQAVQEVKESNYEFIFIFLAWYILRDLTENLKIQNREATQIR